MKVITILSILAFIGIADESDKSSVLVITDDTYHAALKAHPLLFIKFYAPWCGHCQRLAPDWEKVATTLLAKGNKVAIAKMDCTKELEACGENQVRGYPTLRFFEYGDMLEEYGGRRSLEDLKDYAIWKSREHAKKVTEQTEGTKNQQSSLLQPFHLAIPVHNLEEAKNFYGNVLGLSEGRSSEKWQDYNFYGNQVVCHWVGEDYRGRDFYNPVDGDEVPVAHFGAALTIDQFNSLAIRLQEQEVKFIIEPHLRFQGQRGEQMTMFFKDPSNNNLEFKAMTNPDYLFEKAGSY